MRHLFILMATLACAGCGPNMAARSAWENLCRTNSGATISRTDSVSGIIVKKASGVENESGRIDGISTSPVWGINESLWVDYKGYKFIEYEITSGARPNIYKAQAGKSEIDFENPYPYEKGLYRASIAPAGDARCAKFEKQQKKSINKPETECIYVEKIDAFSARYEETTTFISYKKFENRERWQSISTETIEIVDRKSRDVIASSTRHAMQWSQYHVKQTLLPMMGGPDFNIEHCPRDKPLKTTDVLKPLP